MSVVLRPIDQVDLGLVQLLLDEGIDRLTECALALSNDDQLLAIGRGNQILLLPQGAGPGQPVSIALKPGDAVCCMRWAQPGWEGAAADRRAVLLVGASSGRVSAHAADGSLLWSSQLRPAPVLEMHAGCGDGDFDLLCLFDDRTIACVPTLAALLDGAHGASSSSAWLSTGAQRGAAGGAPSEGSAV